MADSESVAPVYLAISNIPANFHSADLRNYFSQFIESGGFHCFHYRHRPEVIRGTEESEQPAGGDGEESRATATESDQVTESRATATEDQVTESRATATEDQVTESRATATEDQVTESRATATEDQVTESRATATEDQVTESGSVKKQAVKSCCCVASVTAKDADRFIRMYGGNHWINSKGNWLARRCVIKRIKVSHDKDDGSFPYKSKYERRYRVSLTERFTEADLRSLPELNPPALMQNGNVGTPVKVFLQLIQSCRLPPRLIRKLGLTFPKTSSNRRYGNVPFHYHDTWTLPATEETVLTAAGHEISGPGTLAAPPSGQRRLADHTDHTTETDDPQKEEEEDTQSHADDDDDCCEEWERHEALHDDVTSQERSKERLFEEEIELKWEKGGSGLVFYTDAQYWQEEEGDFDEQTADDWDVDMSVYYDKDGGDMDARDYVRMRYEKRLRDGLEDRSGHSQTIGSFERFTKGFGRRLMEKQGWKDGEGLGHSQSGISDALENDGQHPNCKRGFGYHGEKLLLHRVKKPRKDFHISTVYDKPKDMDRGDPLLRRQPSTSMKYRGWQPGGSIGPQR